MNLTQLLILQFIAHLLTDYTFQTEKKAQEKNDNGFKSKFLKWHILIAFSVSWILSFQLYFIVGSLTIALVHWLLDGIKKYINNNPVTEKYSFFIDQLLHLAIITSTVFLFHNYIEIKPVFTLSISSKYLLIIAGYILCTKPANIIIGEILNAFEININNTDNKNLPKTGKLIGITERFLVLTFIILNQFEAIGFLIAAKSILRYKNDETLKTEYVLIGTMLSFGIAIAFGTIINLI